jgi:hypothetical protein
MNHLERLNGRLILLRFVVSTWFGFWIDEAITDWYMKVPFESNPCVRMGMEFVLIFSVRVDEKKKFFVRLSGWSGHYMQDIFDLIQHLRGNKTRIIVESIKKAQGSCYKNKMLYGVDYIFKYRMSCRVLFVVGYRRGSTYPILVAVSG